MEGFLLMADPLQDMGILQMLDLFQVHLEMS